MSTEISKLLAAAKRDMATAPKVLPTAAPERSLGQMLSEGFTRGREETTLDELDDLVASGLADPLQAEALRKQYRLLEQVDPLRASDFVNDSIKGNALFVLGEVARMGGQMAQGQANARMAGALGAGSAAAIAGPAAPIAVPVAAGVGATAGGAMASYRQGRGMMYRGMLDAGVDHETASQWSAIGAAPYALVEMAQLATLTKSSTKIFGAMLPDEWKAKMTAQLAKRTPAMIAKIAGWAGKDKTIRGTVAREGADIAEQVGQEGVQRIIEEVTNMTGESIAGVLEEKTLGEKTDRVLGGAVDEMKEAAGPMAVLSLVTAIGLKLPPAALRKLQKRVEDGGYEPPMLAGDPAIKPDDSFWKTPPTGGPATPPGPGAPPVTPVPPAGVPPGVNAPAETPPAGAASATAGPSTQAGGASSLPTLPTDLGLAVDQLQATMELTVNGKPTRPVFEFESDIDKALWRIKRKSGPHAALRDWLTGLGMDDATIKAGADQVYARAVEMAKADPSAVDAFVVPSTVTPPAKPAGQLTSTPAPLVSPVAAAVAAAPAPSVTPTPAPALTPVAQGVADANAAKQPKAVTAADTAWLAAFDATETPDAPPTKPTSPPDAGMMPAQELDPDDKFPPIWLPVEAIGETDEVPQFKRKTKPLKGDYNLIPRNPITVWQRKDGSYKIITGRHRLALMRKTGGKKILAQVVKEADGYDATWARMFDAKVNILDNQGEFYDFAKFFRQAKGLTYAEAEAEGLFRHSDTRKAWDVGKYASEELWAAFASEDLTEDQTWAIVNAVKDDFGAQQVGIKFAQEGHTPAQLVTLLEVAKVRARGQPMDQGSLFGDDDSAMEEMKKNMAAVVKFRRDLAARVKAVKNAAENPDAAKAGGVDVADQAATLALVKDLRQQWERWQNWSVHPDLVALVTKGNKEPAKPAEPLTLAGDKEPDAKKPKVVPKSAPDPVSDGELTLTGQTEAEMAAEAAAKKQREEIEAAGKKPLTGATPPGLGVPDLIDPIAGDAPLFGQPDEAKPPKAPEPPPAPDKDAALMTPAELLASEATPQQKAVFIRAMAKAADNGNGKGVSVKVMEERIEVEIVRHADAIVRRGLANQDGAQNIFRDLLALYARQPVLSARDSTSVANQAYSTPAPLAFLAGWMVDAQSAKRVYEPTAGNGMLLIGLDKAKTNANELDPARASNLVKLGFPNVTTQDATNENPRPGGMDVVLANPPFGKRTDGRSDYGRWTIKKLDHLIALRALESLPAAGRATLILGANREEGSVGKGADTIFFNYLYNNFNVVANFEVSGDLYTKQGASWPVRVIVLSGRQKTATIEKLSPESVPHYKTWNEVYQAAREARNAVETGRTSVGPSGQPGATGDSQGGRKAPGQPPGNVEAANQPGQSSDAGSTGSQGAGVRGKPASGPAAVGRPAGDGAADGQGGGDQAGNGGVSANPVGQRPADVAPGDSGLQPGVAGSEPGGDAGLGGRDAGQLSGRALVAPEDHARLAELHAAISAATKAGPDAIDGAYLNEGAELVRLFAKNGMTNFRDFLKVFKADLPESWGPWQTSLAPMWNHARAQYPNLPEIMRAESKAARAEVDATPVAKTPPAPPKPLTERQKRIASVQLALDLGMAADRGPLLDSVQDLASDVFWNDGADFREFAKLVKSEFKKAWPRVQAVLRPEWNAVVGHGPDFVTPAREAAVIAELDTPRPPKKDKPPAPPPAPPPKPPEKTQAEKDAELAAAEAELRDQLRRRKGTGPADNRRFSLGAPPPASVDPGLLAAGTKYLLALANQGIKTFKAAVEKMKAVFEEEWAELRGALKSMWNKAGEQNESLEEVSGDVMTRILDEIDANEKADQESESAQVLVKTSSKAPGLGTLSPRSVARGTENALSELEAEVGNIDEWVAKELGYKSVDELWYQPGKDANGERQSRLAAEQIDGIALAIAQARKDGAIIIGDETGIGKGRQGAGIMKWAMLQGYIPVFLTADPKLFTDMYYDMDALGFAEEWKPMLLADKNKGVISSPDGKTVLRRPPKAQRADMDAFAASGVSDRYNAVAVTYPQINQQNARQEFLMDLADRHDVVLVIDESHLAAGAESAQGTFMRGGMIQRGKGSQRRTIRYAGLLNARNIKGTVYMSATWAKNPDNMAVYYRTELGRAAGSMGQLTQAIKSGGVALQQMVADGLASAGQMIRRERDFAGVTFTRPTVQADQKEKIVRDMDQAVGVLNGIIQFSELVRQRVKALDEDTQATAQTETQLDYTPFANTAHNSISHLTLALKVDAVADMAIEAYKRGEKPVIALMNTTEGIMDELFDTAKAGEGAVVSLTYNDLLKRNLDRTLRATQKDAMGNHVAIITFTPEELGLEDEYQDMLDSIATVNIKVPMSPIDAITAKLKAAGIRVGEMTGRESMLEYEPGSYRTGVHRKRKKINKNTIVREFNGGQMDALILNSSGAVGLSIHASPAFAEKPVKKRHMIIAQPHLDIAVMVQMLGRIKRTNMIPGGAIYTMPTLPLEVERRPAMVLERKLKSLNANTTADPEGTVALQSTDFMNKYGDQVVAELMHDDPAYIADTRISPKYTQDGAPRPGLADFARVFAGRLAYLPNARQVIAYKEVLTRYDERVKELKDQGEYDLEVIVYDNWDGTLKSDQLMRPGENDNNTLQGSLRLQQWEILDTRHRATSEEMEKEFTKKLISPKVFADGIQSRIETTLEELRDLKALKETQIIENNRAMAAADAAALGGDPDAAAEATRIRTVIAVLRSRLEELQTQERYFTENTIPALVELSNLGGQYVSVVTDSRAVPAEQGIGMIVGFAMKAPGAGVVHTAGSDFAVTVLMSKPGGRERIPVGSLITGRASIQVSNPPVTKEEIDRRVEDTRYDRYFLVGNPIRAYGISGNTGKVVSFKSRAGQEITGVLMPVKWQPKDLVHDPRFDFINAQAALEFLDANPLAKIQNGVATYGRQKLRDPPLLTVPFPQNTGLVYYGDAELRRLTGGFNKRGNKMISGAVPDNKGGFRGAAVLTRVQEISTMQWNLPHADRNIQSRDEITRINAKHTTPAKARFSLGQAPRFVRNTNELTDLAADEEEFKNWYAEFRVFLDNYLGEYKEYGPLIAELLSVTSAANTVAGNVTMMVRALREYIDTGAFESFNKFPAHFNNLNRIARGERPNGPKISQYSDGIFGNPNAKPVDRHISTIMFNREKPLVPHTRAAMRRMDQIASILGWEPIQAQAALWAANRRINNQPEDSYERHLLKYGPAIRQLLELDRAGAGRGREASRRIDRRLGLSGAARPAATNAAAAQVNPPGARMSLAPVWQRAKATFASDEYAQDDVGFTAVATMATLKEPARDEAIRLLEAEIDSLTASGAKVSKKVLNLLEGLRSRGNAARFSITERPPHLSFGEALGALEKMPFGPVLRDKVRLVFQPAVPWEAYYLSDGKGNDGAIVVNLANLQTTRRLKEVIEHEATHRILELHPEIIAEMGATMTPEERASVEAWTRKAYAKAFEDMTAEDAAALMREEMDVRMVDKMVEQYRALPWFKKLVANIMRVAHEVGLTKLSNLAAQSLAARAVGRAFDPNYKGTLAARIGELQAAPATYFHTPDLSRPFGAEPWSDKLAHWAQWGYKAGGIAERMGKHTRKVLGELAGNKQVAMARKREADALLKRMGKLFPGLESELVAAINGSIQWADIQHQDQPAVQEGIALARQVRARVDALSTALVAMGVAKDNIAVTIMKHRGVYLTRVYQKFINDGWVPVRQVQQAALDEILAGLYRTSNIKVRQLNTVLKRLVKDNPDRAQVLLDWLQGMVHDNSAAARGLDPLEDLAKASGKELSAAEKNALVWLRGAYKGLNDSMDLKLRHEIRDGVPSVYITKSTEEFIQTAQGTLAWLIAKDTTLERFRKAEGPGGAAAWRAVRSQLMHRKELTPAMRQLFGEVKDLAEVAYLTELRQQNMLTQFHYQQELWKAQAALDDKHPERFIYGDRRVITDASGKRRIYDQQIPGDAKYGDLAGKFTDANTWKVITNAEDTATGVFKAISTLVGINGVWRSLMVFYNAPSYPRQAAGSAMMALAAGEALRPKFGLNMAKAIKVLVQRGAEYEALTRATVVGVDASVLDAEIVASLRDAGALVNWHTSGAVADFLRVYWRKVAAVARRTHELMRQAFVAGDDMVKIATYYNMRDRGMSQQEAVDQVRMILPYYDMAPKVITDLLRRVGPDFITFKAELLRNQINTAKLIGQDLKAGRLGDAAIRTAGIGTLGVTGTAIGASALAWAATALMGGEYEPPDEEELQAAVLLRPDYTEGNAMLFWRDDEGQLNLVDYGFISPYELQNSLLWIATLPDLTIDQKLQKIARVTWDYFSAGGLGSGITGLTRAVQGDDPRGRPKPIREPGDDFWTSAHKTVNAVYEHFRPSSITRLGRAYDVMQNGAPIIDATGQERTVANQLAGTVLPFNIQRIVPAALLLSHAYQYAGSLNRKKSDVSRIAKRVDEGQAPYENQAEVEAGHTAANNREYAMFQLRVKAASRLGVDDKQIREILKQAGLNQEEVKGLLREYSPDPIEAR